MTSPKCEKCGREDQAHTFRELLTCMYGGQPLKDGGVFTERTAEKIVDGIVKRLGGLFGPEVTQ